MTSSTVGKMVQPVLGHLIMGKIQMKNGDNSCSLTDPMGPPISYAGSVIDMPVGTSICRFMPGGVIVTPVHAGYAGRHNGYADRHIIWRYALSSLCGTA